jgi:G3E family GTPase
MLHPPAGKTTLLRYVLENTTEKIACIVNDVAQINIDAKLMRNDRNRGTNTTADLTDTIELANGCACELLPEQTSSSRCNSARRGLNSTRSLRRLQHPGRTVSVL